MHTGASSTKGFRWFGQAFALLVSAATSCAAAPGDTAAAQSGKVFAWHPFLAPFHAVVLHLPIGFLLLGAILEVYRCYRPSEELKRVVRMVIGLSLTAAVLTAALGLLRASGGGYEPKAVQLHRWTGLAVPVCTMVTLVLERISSPRSEAIGLYRLSLAGTLGVLLVAGHLGGNLTHGSGYLVENAPAFIRDLLEPANLARPVPVSAGDEQQRFYAAKVEPVFKAKCYRCHGPEKQKGGFRLDDPAVAVRGGSSGKPAVKQGDVLGSNLARLILLPPDHDDVMPPSGKEPLTLEELMNIVHWIRSGAVFTGQAVAGRAE